MYVGNSMWYVQGHELQSQMPQHSNSGSAPAQQCTWGQLLSLDFLHYKVGLKHLP